MKYCLAMDVSMGKSMCCIMSEEGELLLSPSEYPHCITGFEELMTRLNRIGSDDVHIIMESTSVYHLSAERFFKENSNYEVIVLNPLISKENKKSLRKTKTDKEDCLNLSNIFFHGKYNGQFKHETAYNEIQTLSRQINHLQEGQNRTKNRFRQLISMSCPEYAEVFRPDFIYKPTALHFIENYPHCDLIKLNNVDTLAECLAEAHERSAKRYLKMAAKIKSAFQDSYPAVLAESETVKCLVELTQKIQVQQTEIEALKNRMAILAQQTYLYPLYISIPGIGPYLASALIAELKDIRRFNNAKQLTASCGLDPTIIQSGKSVNYHGPISKRGNKYVRYILFNAVMSMLMIGKQSDPEGAIRLYYEKKRGEGKHHHACVVACCTKLLRILFAMSKQNSLYR